MSNLIRNLLIEHWDPLQIGDNPNLQDEYDSYIPDLLKLLNTGSPLDEVNEYLKKVEAILEVQVKDQVRMRVSQMLIDRTGR